MKIVVLMKQVPNEDAAIKIDSNNLSIIEDNVTFITNEPDTYGLKTMSWNRYIVWDRYQENFYKQYSPKSEFIQSGYINIGGFSFNLNLKKDKKTLAIFDVTPSRTIFHCTQGFALPTSVPKWSLDFLRKKYSIPIIDVIQPTIKLSLKIKSNKTICFTS